jgi:hypothetical protein
MSNSAKKEYLIEIKKRYSSATKNEKSLILDQFCTVCCYNRKYPIRLFSRQENKYYSRKRRPRKYYSKAIKDFSKDIWIVTKLACSQRSKAAIPLWLPFYTIHHYNSFTEKER